jgi:hypothetical protein
VQNVERDRARDAEPRSGVVNRRLRRSWSRGERCSRTVLLRPDGCVIYGATTPTHVIRTVHRVPRYRRFVAHAQPQQRGSFTAAKVLWRGAMLLCECRVAGPCSGPSRGGHQQVQGIVKRCAIAGQWPFHTIILYRSQQESVRNTPHDADRCSRAILHPWSALTLRKWGECAVMGRVRCYVVAGGKETGGGKEEVVLPAGRAVTPRLVPLTSSAACRR